MGNCSNKSVRKCLLDDLTVDIVNLIIYFSNSKSLISFQNFGWLTEEEYQPRIYQLCNCYMSNRLTMNIPFKQHTDYRVIYELIRTIRCAENNLFDFDMSEFSD